MIYILDAIVVLTIIFTLIAIVKKGFVRTVLDFVSVICAIILAKVFSPPLSEYFYDGVNKVFSEGLKNTVNELLRKNDLPDLLQSDKISEFLSKYNLGLADNISSEIIGDAGEFIAQQLVGLLSYVLAFFVIFILTVIAFKLASLIFGGIFELPILKTVNKTLAFFLGVVMAAFYVLVFVAFMQILMPVLNSVYPAVFNSSEIDKTILFGYLYNFEWIEFLVN